MIKRPITSNGGFLPLAEAFDIIKNCPAAAWSLSAGLLGFQDEYLEHLSPVSFAELTGEENNEFLFLDANGCYVKFREGENKKIRCSDKVMYLIDFEGDEIPISFLDVKPICVP